MKGGKSAFPEDFRFTSNPTPATRNPLLPPRVVGPVPEISVQGAHRQPNVLERTFMPKDMTYGEELVGFVKKQEEFKPAPYNDPGVGYPTIGYGHKLENGYDPNMRWTEQEADAQLRRDMNDAAKGVQNKVAVPITQGMMNGLTSMFYNIGPEKFPGTQADKKLRAGDYLGAATEMLTFDNVRKDGKLVPLKGLTDRRRLEAEMAAGAKKHLLPPDRPKTNRKRYVAPTRHAAFCFCSGCGMLSGISARGSKKSGRDNMHGQRRVCSRKAGSVERQVYHGDVDYGGYRVL